MENQIYTLSLARLYETQGHPADALDQYWGVNATAPCREAEQGIERTQKRVTHDSSGPVRLPSGHQASDPASLERILEKWMSLVLFETRLSRLEKYQTLTESR